MRKDQSYLRMIHASKETIEHERGKIGGKHLQL
jgi:hypothetical protein